MPTPLAVEVIKYRYLKLLIILKTHILSLQDVKSTVERDCGTGWFVCSIIRTCAR